MRRSVFALALFTGAYSGTARADDPPVELEWNVPAGERCPPPDEVLRQVARLVGASPSHERPSIRAQAEVRKLGDDRFRLDLTTESDGSEGHRVIEERSCGAMAEATAVILAWMIDPDAVDASSGAERKVSEDADGTRKSKPEADDRRSRESTAEDRGTVPVPPRLGARATNLVLGVAGVFDSSTLPAFAAGFGVELGARWTAFRILARGAMWANQTAHVAQGARAAGAELRLTTLGIDACVAPWRWDIAACAGPELDRMQGTGFGVDEPRTDSSSWISLGLGIEGRMGLFGPVGVTLGARLVVPTRRETFGLDGVGNVHRVGALTGRGAIGLDAVF